MLLQEDLGTMLGQDLWEGYRIRGLRLEGLRIWWSYVVLVALDRPYLSWML